MFASILLAVLIISLIIKISNILYPIKSNNNLPAHANSVDMSARGYYIALPQKQSASTGIAKIVEVVVDIKKLIEKASLERGAVISKKCVSCHSFEKDGPNKIGPNLFDIYNKNKASNSSYKYSQSLYDKGGKWGDEELFAFLKNPKKYIDGTKMAFPGLEKAEDIADMILFLKNNKP